MLFRSWNPIGVDSHLAINEYSGYIPMILKVITDQQKLLNCLEEILTNKLGIDFDSNNQNHINDLKMICDKIFQMYQESKKDN